MIGKKLVLIMLILLFFQFTPSFSKNAYDEWNKTYGGFDYEEAYDILDIGNGFILTGDSSTYGQGAYNGWIFKIDENGNEIWNKTFGGRDVANKVIEHGGNYHIVGSTDSFGKGGDAWLIKCSDYNPPNLKIDRPKEGYLYIGDKELLYIGRTIIVGPITIDATISNGNVERVEFYINRPDSYSTKPEKIVYEPPYSFKWDEKTNWMKYYSIDAIAYYSKSAANTADRIYFRIINW